jgi:prepilin-type N-terminal cleavage/methylation domain-containing protein
MASLPRNNSKGFTLIEILVASMILFASFATVALLYRGALLSSDKAANHLQISAVVPEVLGQVRKSIRMQGKQPLEQLQGSGAMWQVRFEWQAQLEEFKAPAPIFDVDTGQYIEQPAKYKLWLVDLTLDHDGTQREYSFEELSWNDS